MALYTGKGDGGMTKVFDSKERIPKSSELPEALGSLDELNSFLGLAKVRARDLSRGEDPFATVAGILHGVQETLFIVQAEIAGAEKHVSAEKVKWAEEIIHAVEKEIPPITTFSIPGGTELSALLDVARTLARRAERRIVAVENTGARTPSPDTRAFMNRLSSLLFALARLVNFKSGVQEEGPSYK